MKTLEELVKEYEEITEKSTEYYQKKKELESMIRAMTEKNIKDYIGKFICLETYYTKRYLLVNEVSENSWDKTWGLKGPGFEVWEKKGGFLGFSSSPNEISSDDLLDKQGKITIISEEEFYQQRQNYINQLLNEKYE